MSIILASEELKKQYFMGEVTVDALQGVDFLVQRGEFVAVMGPSGSGKSLLLKMLLGFVKPDKGEIFINGEELNKHSIKNIRQKIAYISQGVELKKIKVKEFFDEIFSLKNNRERKVKLEKIKRV